MVDDTSDANCWDVKGSIVAVNPWDSKSEKCNKIWSNYPPWNCLLVKGRMKGENVVSTSASSPKEGEWTVGEAVEAKVSEARRAL